MKTCFDHFGFLAPHYDHIFSANKKARIWNLFEIPSNALILDAGGGTGRISQAFQQGTNKVIIADQSFIMLVEAKKKTGLLPNCAVTESLPYTDSLFDAIIMVDALHHVADSRRSTAELWRVLKPGGRIVIEEPNIDRFGVKLLALVEKLALMRSHFISAKDIVALFRSFPAHCRIEKEGALAWIIIDKEKH